VAWLLLCSSSGSKVILSSLIVGPVCGQCSCWKDVVCVGGFSKSLFVELLKVTTASLHQDLLQDVEPVHLPSTFTFNLCHFANSISHRLRIIHFSYISTPKI
jgi:hypothetical protein